MDKEHWKLLKPATAIRIILREKSSNLPVPNKVARTFATADLNLQCRPNLIANLKYNMCAGNNNFQQRYISELLKYWNANAPRIWRYRKYCARFSYLSRSVCFWNPTNFPETSKYSSGKLHWRRKLRQIVRFLPFAYIFRNVWSRQNRNFTKTLSFRKVTVLQQNQFFSVSFYFYNAQK